MKSSISESEANLSMSKQEIGLDDRSASRHRRLEANLAAARRALEKAAEEEESVTRHLLELTKDQEEEQARLSQELEGIRSATMRQASTLNDQWQQAKADQDQSSPSNLDLDRSRRESPAATGRVRERSAHRESDQSHGVLAEPGRSANGLSQLHTKLEGHIQRLQRHTDQLRSNLHGTRGTPTNFSRTAISAASETPAMLQREQSAGTLLPTAA